MRHDKLLLRCWVQSSSCSLIRERAKDFYRSAQRFGDEMELEQTNKGACDWKVGSKSLAWLKKITMIFMNDKSITIKHQKRRDLQREALERVREKERRQRERERVGHRERERDDKEIYTRWRNGDSRKIVERC